jgi:hypothetical protein
MVACCVLSLFFKDGAFFKHLLVLILGHPSPLGGKLGEGSEIRQRQPARLAGPECCLSGAFRP